MSTIKEFAEREKNFVTDNYRLNVISDLTNIVHSVLVVLSA